MKRVIIAFDGIGDEPIEALDGKTPLEIAKKPNMNAMAREGALGRLRLGNGKSRPSEELACLELLNNGAALEAGTRGPLAAAAIDLKVPADDWLMACRLVTVHDGKLVDPYAGNIGDRESAALFETLNRTFKDRDIRFYTGENRCHVLSIKADEEFARLGEADPGDPMTAVGREQFGAWTKGPAGSRLKALLTEAAEILETHEVNKVRVDLNENPANALWVWGAGHPLRLKPFAGAGGAVVLSSSDAWKGAARAAGLDWAPALTAAKPEPSDLAELTERLAGWVRSHDWVYLHLSETDRCAIAGDYRKKIRWIEALDQHLLGGLKERLGAGARVALVSGHVTSSERRERTSPEAPYLLWGASVDASDCPEFTEEASARAGKALDGNEFFKKLN